MLVSFDTETTGLDVHHGCNPFFVTFCNGEGKVTFWEWDVDPLTRQPYIPPDSLSRIRNCIRSSEHLILQNAKFDYAALKAIDPDLDTAWDWSKVRDTLVAGHLLASNHPHDLTSMAVEYLGVDIEPYETALEQATKEAQRYVRSHLNWRIAHRDLSEMPSARDKIWKYDTWLPRALATHRGDPIGECTAVNYREERCDVRIGRGTKWGNPFTHLPLEDTGATYQVSSRAEAISKYRDWIGNQPHLLESLYELDGKKLGCTCKKRGQNIPCHGDVLAELVRKRRHPYYDLLKNYANTDSAITVALWTKQWELLRKRNLEKIYLEMMKIPPIISGMERRGVTLHGERLTAGKDRHRAESVKEGEYCRRIAATYSIPCPECNVMSPEYVTVPLKSPDSKTQKLFCVTCAGEKMIPYTIELPKSGNNTSLSRFLFEVAKVPALGRSERTGAPSLDKKVLEAYETVLPPRSKTLAFIRALKRKRKRDTAAQYMEGYERFWLPLQGNEGWYVLHPSLNPTGTDTLRMSSSNPNAQNIGKQTEKCARCEGDGCEECNYSGEIFLSLRYPFGPAPGREWWSLDYENIELRIPSYESGEEAMIELFERPDDPPYYGSQHLLYFAALHPDKFSEHGKKVKDVYKASWYQWTKNGDFAILYGAQEATADAAYHVKGAYCLLKSRFRKLESLNQKYIQMATRLGYVETIPDKTVDPSRGYPILCTRTEYGRILPTVPLNYHVQSTAMWCTRKAMIRCEEYLQSLSREDRRGYYMTLQIHDEIVFDFPKGVKDNLPKIQECRRLMEKSGEDIGIPLKVAVTYNPVTWAKGEDV